MKNMAGYIYVFLLVSGTALIVAGILKFNDLTLLGSSLLIGAGLAEMIVAIIVKRRFRKPGELPEDDRQAIQ